MKLNSDQYALFDDLNTGEKSPGDYRHEILPVCDGGYFDALAAIGLAAVVHSYLNIDEADSPLIEWTPNGFKVSYADKPERAVPDVGWLRYSVAGAWRKGDKDKWKVPANYTKKAKGWDGLELISTDGAEIDVSKETQITIPLGEGTITLMEPMRQLYGVANKLGSPEWFNLCVFACRSRGIELIDGSFSEKNVPLNSVVLPQASKGAAGSNSFSIVNTSLADTISTLLSRCTCLAVAGFIIAAKGQSPQKAVQGFAIPVPKILRLDTVKRISNSNRRRLANGGFFFAYDNYLSFIKQLLIYKADVIDISDEESSLFSISGANFIPLGNSSSPSSSWQLLVPKHRYSISSVGRLQTLLIRWKLASQAGQNKTVSVDRASVAKLMRGFEYSDPAEIASGYLDYVFDVGLVTKKDSFYPLTQNLFEEIMEDKYQSLLRELREDGDLRPFVDLVRRETYTVATTPGQSKKQPNYQMIRSLREVQNKEDFIKAVTEIAIERGVTKLATAQSRDSKAKHWAYAHEVSLVKLIELADSEYPPKLLANLILAFALSKRPQAEGEEDPEVDSETVLNDENND